MKDLTPGARYAVTVAHTFDGEFLEVVEKGSPPRRYAIFATDSAAGNPTAGSGKRFVLLDGAEVKAEPLVAGE